MIPRPSKAMLRTFVAAFAAAAVLAFAATAASAQEPEFRITIQNHRFDPAEVTVPANTKVKLVIENKDSTPEEFESKELKREKVIAPNSTGVITVGPLKPGKYPFFGEFNAKTAQGVLIVK